MCLRIIAILLNIHEEHLDHYGTMEKYVHAKQQIYLHRRNRTCSSADWMYFQQREPALPTFSPYQTGSLPVM